MNRDSFGEVSVRRATTADVPRLGALGARLVAEHHAFDAKRFLPAQNRTIVEYGKFLGSQIDDPDSVIFVAEVGGHVIGYTYVAIEGYDYMALRGPAGVLQDVIVDPEQRGHGIGRLLLETAIAYLRSRGIPRVVLSTAERNAAAQRLFERMGFRRTMVEMTRELDDPTEA